MYSALYMINDIVKNISASLLYIPIECQEMEIFFVV